MWTIVEIILRHKKPSSSFPNWMRTLLHDSCRMCNTFGPMQLTMYHLYIWSIASYPGCIMPAWRHVLHMWEWDTHLFCKKCLDYYHWICCLVNMYHCAMSDGFWMFAIIERMDFNVANDTHHGHLWIMSLVRFLDIVFKTWDIFYGADEDTWRKVVWRSGEEG